MLTIGSLVKLHIYIQTYAHDALYFEQLLMMFISQFVYLAGLSMDKLKSIGCVRFCLSVVADCMVDALQDGEASRKLFDAAERACYSWKMDGARSET